MYTLELGKINAGFVQSFSDDLQAISFTDFGEDLQTFFTEALKCVGRSTRLERAAAKEPGAASADSFGDGESLCAAFDCASALSRCSRYFVSIRNFRLLFRQSPVRALIIARGFANKSDSRAALKGKST